jgi:hypothetical protein
MSLGRHHLVGLFGLLLLGLLGVAFLPGMMRRPGPPQPAPAVTPGPEEKDKDKEEEAGPPRLAVLIVFDQLRGDFLLRWDDLFEQGGFHRLEREGAWFQDCHYPYAGTWTGPGHASVVAGCSPERHGIVANEWHDAVARKQVSCVGTDRGWVPVPAPLGKAGERKGRGASPEWLLAPTLADALKEATGGKGRVVALSLKDRSAVLPGGMRPDACYWADKDGRFVTSTYYRAAPHAWVRAFNRERVADRWFGRSWDRLRPDLDYARRSGPDDVPGEGAPGFTRTFPHALAGKGKSPDAAYYNALASSPFGNDLLLELTRRAVEAEGLGTRQVPDLLSVSFSSNDLVGHIWGPDSQEVLDTTLRSDRIVKSFLELLDRHVGQGRYVVALTADHGICPLPEVARSHGKDGGRIDSRLLLGQAEAALDRAFPAKAKVAPKERWVDAAEGPMLYLNRSLIGRLRLPLEAVEGALAGWLVQQRGVQAAYTYTQLKAGVPKEDAVGRMVQRSFHPERSGDVVLVVKPHYLFGTFLTGTNHGSPHPYDTHVPLLVYGPGVKQGARRERVTPQAAAAILARALGIKPPAGAEVGVPEGLFAAKGG